MERIEFNNIYKRLCQQQYPKRSILNRNTEKKTLGKKEKKYKKKKEERIRREKKKKNTHKARDEQEAGGK